MEIRYLRSFIAAAKYRHFGKAADSLNLAQSALSRHIRSLEAEIGGVLFNRTSRSVSLTLCGEAFYADLVPLLEDLEASVARARRVAGGQGEVVRLSLAPNFAYTHAPAILSAISKQHETLHLELHDLPFAQQREALLQGRIDLAISNLKIESIELITECLGAEELVAVLPAHHLLADRKSIPLREVAAQPFIVCPRYESTGFHELILDIFRKAGLVPNLAQAIDNKAVMARVIAAGHGITLLPVSALNSGLPECVGRPISDTDCSVDNYLIWSPQRDRPAVESVRTVIRDLSLSGFTLKGTARPA